MTLAELKALFAKLMGEAKEIMANAKKEGKENDAETLEAVNAKMDEADKTAEEIEKLEALQKNVADTKARLEAADKYSNTPNPKTVGNVNIDPNKPLVTEIHENIADDPMKGFKSHLEFLSEVMNVSLGQKLKDDRMKFLSAAGSDENKTNSDPFGGFLVPVGMSPDVKEVQPEADPTIGRIQNIPMTTPTLKINARVDKNHTTSVSGGFIVSRKAETAAAIASKQKYEQIKLEANSLFGLNFATEELLTDSLPAFITLLQRGFRQEFTSHLLNEKLFGTGVGEYEGFLNSAAKVTAATVSASKKITYLDILEMRSRAWGYGSAIWLANQDTIPQLGLINIISGANTTFMTSPREDVPSMLLGRPIFFSEYMKTLGDEGDIALTNWNEYLEGTLQGLQSGESTHVRFLNHERAFKFWMRNDGKCWWSSPLTPKNSAATLSPVVTLTARP